MDKFIMWLRKHHPGTIIVMRDFILHLTSIVGIIPLHAQLSIRVTRKDGSVKDKGVVSIHAVTDAFVAELVDTLQSAVANFSNYKYHDSGQGVTGENATDTAMETACGESRTTGTQIEGATADIYKSVAEHTYAGDFTITEHGLFNASSGGVLADRSVFSGIAVASGDKIEFTYQLTCTAGG